MSELDGLTERIAEVLGEHQRYWHSDWGHMCSCGHRGMFTLTIEAAAAHQAEQVRAVLGEVTTEWGIDWTAYGDEIVTVDVQDQALIAAAHAQKAKVLRREVTRTPWIEAP